MSLLIGMGILAVISGIAFGYLWRNLSLVGISYWLSRSNIATTSSKVIPENSKFPPETFKAELNDKLKSLELLQELRESDLISQEEFDAKKKQLLGL